MSSPHTRRPAALAHGEPREDHKAVNPEHRKASASGQSAFGTVADVHTFTDELEIVADWKEDLQTRLARAELLLEIGVELDYADDLAEEVHLFNRLCFGLADWLGRPK